MKPFKDKYFKMPLKVPIKIYQNAVIESASIVDAQNDRAKAIIRQEIDDCKRTTTVLLEFFQDENNRDSLFTLDRIDEIFRKNLFKQLKDIDENCDIYKNRSRMDKNKIKLILETLSNNGKLGRMVAGSVTYYEVKSPTTPQKRREKNLLDLTK